MTDTNGKKMKMNSYLDEKMQLENRIEELREFLKKYYGYRYSVDELSEFSYGYLSDSDDVLGNSIGYTLLEDMADEFGHINCNDVFRALALAEKRLELMNRASCSVPGQLSLFDTACDEQTHEDMAAA